jgi:predicted PurR-regulated permease PerM
MGRAFQAQIMIAICNTIFTYFGLLFLEVDARYFLAVVVFFCSFIPILGFIISTIPMCIVALTQQNGGFGLVFGTILMVFIIHLMEGYVLNPMIMGERFEMNAIIVITILLVGKHFFGLWGLLLGVPVCHYLFRYAIQGHEEPSIRHSGIWRSLYPKQAEEDDTLERVEPTAEETAPPADQSDEH